jgi:hypothetical protein
VCVLLDGEESELTFVDHPSSEMSVSTAMCYSPIPCTLPKYRSVRLHRKLNGVNIAYVSLEIAFRSVERS